MTDDNRPPAPAPADQPGQPPALKGLPLAVISIALALGTFMQVLDSTIANVSIPTIAGDMGVSSDQGTWIITLFAMSNGVSVPLTGWLMARYGIVKTFVGAVVLFTIASLLCGLAWNLNSLLAFRILQGAVSGPMIPGSQALLIAIFPPAKRSAALGIWAITTLTAPICGPILGGWISDNTSWRWIFFINVPVGVLVALLCYRGLISRESPTRKVPIDKVGFMLLLVWVSSLQVMLDRGKDADWFHSPTVVLEGIVAAIGFVSWVIWELTEKHPIVDLSLFRRRNFALGAIAFCVSYGVFFGANVLQPLWLQTQLGYIATWAGLVAAPAGVVAVLLTPIVARFSSKIDARLSATVSLVAFAVSFFMRAGLTPDASFAALVLPNVVQGLAMSTFFVSMITIQLNGIRPEQTPAASGLSNFARITAGGFAASLVTAFWDRRTAFHQNQLAESPTVHPQAWDQAVTALQATGMSMEQAMNALGRTIGSQASTLGALDLFWLAGWLSLAMVPVVWMARRALNQGTVHAAD